MSCPICKGTGFILKRGDFKAMSGTVYKATESVTRCPEYKLYFRELPSVMDKPIWDSRCCDFAVKTHHEIREHRLKKEEKKGRSKF